MLQQEKMQTRLSKILHEFTDLLSKTGFSFSFLYLTVIKKQHTGWFSTGAGREAIVQESS